MEKVQTRVLYARMIDTGRWEPFALIADGVGVRRFLLKNVSLPLSEKADDLEAGEIVHHPVSPEGVSHWCLKIWYPELPVV
jgi:hypothetical protein